MSDFDRQTCTRFARRLAALSALLVAGIVCPSACDGLEATYVSANFVVTASTEAVASGVAAAAEESRSRFASQWLDTELSAWDVPCRIVVEERASGGEGWVSYERFRGRIENVQIIVRGQLDRILEYVLPHEVAHATLAVSLRQPVPRWVDEGVALLCESESQRRRQQKMVVELANMDSILPLESILRVDDYPERHEDLVGFYASCYSLTEFLVSQRGRQGLLDFVRDGAEAGWEAALVRHYGANLQDLEAAWRAQLSAGDQDSSTRVAVVVETPSP